MSVFVDTGVLYSHHDQDATRHDIAAQALAHVLGSAAYGRVLTSEYVYDETVTLTHRRTGRVSDAMTAAMVEYHEVDSVLSFDDDFDGVVDRLAPATVVE